MARRALTAQERMDALSSDRRRLARERLIREVAGERWERMVKITPALFDREGTPSIHKMLRPAGEVIEALKADGVFALDTAMRLALGHGFLKSGDVQVYLTSADAVDRLAALGLIDRAEFGDRVLVRAWPGPARLVAAIVEVPPPSRLLPSGFRVVTPERLREELIGAVGARADLFALAEATW